MIRMTLKGLLARKLRLALTSLAIVLGVGMVTGTFSLTDTVNAGVHDIIGGAYANADAVVSAKAVFGGGDVNSFPESTLGRIRGLHDVRSAGGEAAGRGHRRAAPGGRRRGDRGRALWRRPHLRHHRPGGRDRPRPLAAPAAPLDGRLRRRHGAAGRGRGDRRQELRPLAPPGRRFAAPPGDLDGKDARAAGDGDQRPANVREPPLGTIAISSRTFDAAYTNVTAANTRPLDHVVARFPDARVQSEAEFLSSQRGRSRASSTCSPSCSRSR